MKSQKFLIFSAALITSVNAFYYNNDDDACSAIGDSCDPENAAPCCDDAVPCQESDTPGTFLCLEKEKLGASCIYDYDCHKFRNAKCIENKCECPESFVQRNSTFCAVSLDQYCFTDECATLNSACIDYKCQCRPNYLRSGAKCVATRLGQSCASDVDCAEIPSAECSAAKVCICQSNFAENEAGQCLARLGVACSGPNPCVALNSGCIDGRCECSPRYEAISDSECVPIKLNGSCRNSFDCQDVLNTLCSEENRCSCDSDSIESEGRCVPQLAGFCIGDDDCMVKDSACIENICQCRGEFVLQSHGSCAPKSLGTACSDDADCRFVRNSECRENICVCKDKYFGNGEFLCSPIIGGRCENSTECFFSTLQCIDRRCQCSAGSTAISSSQCVASHLMYSCRHASECADSWHTQCWERKCRCKADDNISLSRASCLPLLGGICWKNDQCITKNSGCIGRECRCNPGFVSVAKNLCVPAEL